MSLGVLRPDGTATWFGTFPAHSWLGYVLPSGSGSVTHTLTRFPFGGSIHYAGGSDRIWIGDSESGSIKLFGIGGHLIKTIEALIPRRRLSREALERSRRLALESSAGAAAVARINAVHDRGRNLDQAPAFSSFTPGPNGELWVESFRESELEPGVVVVLDRSGRTIGGVELPVGTRLLEAGSGYLLVLTRDADGVESVALYTLRR